MIGIFHGFDASVYFDITRRDALWQKDVDSLTMLKACDFAQTGSRSPGADNQADAEWLGSAQVGVKGVGISFAIFRISSCSEQSSTKFPASAKQNHAYRI